jgi:hypothetical protein
MQDHEKCSPRGANPAGIEESPSDTLEMHDSVCFKLKGTGRKKPIAEGRSGQEFFRNGQRWVNKERLIDRGANPKWYREMITDSVTGEVIHTCDEPLDQHVGHGSAKTKRVI